MKEKLLARSGGKCELCRKESELSVYKVLPDGYGDAEILICASLIPQIEGSEPLRPGEWLFLTDAMWSEVPAVQVLSWRMLNRLKGESWATEALDILYLEEETLAWAKDWAGPDDSPAVVIEHKDAFGNILQDGDSVVLTKTLDVKGSSISAKLGTVVRNIRLVPNNAEQIEGRVEGQQIVILTKYLRKQS